MSGMGKQDARSLPAKAQEDLRRRVVEAVQKGLSQNRSGADLRGGPGYGEPLDGARGTRRAPGTESPTSKTASGFAIGPASGRHHGTLHGQWLCPDQLSLPFALWTREAVQKLLWRKFDVQVSVWTVGRYLRAWRLTPQKPVRRVYEQNLAAVLYRHVPRDLVDRPKFGFGIPVDSWLRGPLREWAEALLDEKRLRNEGYFDPRPIRRIWTEHLAGQGVWQYHLWDILMFEEWLEKNGAAVSGERTAVAAFAG